MLSTVINKFNRGIIDDLALSREEIKKVSNSAVIMENWMPMRLGPMIHAPGIEDIGALAGNGIMLPFVRSINDTALVELTNNKMRVWVDGAPIARTSVTSTIPALTTWTAGSGSGSTVTYSSGSALFKAADTTEAQISYTIAATDTGKAHGIRIVVTRGPIRLRLGTSGAGSTDIEDLTLGTGEHSLSVTPASNLTLTLSSEKTYTVIVASVSIESAGAVEIPTNVAASDLENVRWVQSGSVLFCTKTGRQFKIERRGKTSWGYASYETEDGPFGIVNLTQTTLAANALDGDVTIVASSAYFKSNMIGDLLRIASASQAVDAIVTASGNGTNSIRVTGVGAARTINFSITGTWAGTVVLQRSSDDTTWEDALTYTANITSGYGDELDNSTLYYRLYVTALTSGTVNLQITYSGGSIEGIARLVSVSSSTSAGAVVLKPFGATDASINWYRGQWNSDDGFPTALLIDEGRIIFAGNSQYWESVSDAYYSFDRQIKGNSRSIYRTIGFGPTDRIHWLDSSVRVVMGITSDDVSVRSSSFGEIRTNDNVNLKPGTRQGSANIPPCVEGGSIFYVHRSEQKIHELRYSASVDSHISIDLNKLNQDIGKTKYKRIVIAMEPETRIFAVMQDGSVSILLVDDSENVLGWSIRKFKYPCVDVVVLPALGEDVVYFVLNTGSGYRLQQMDSVGNAVVSPVDMFKRGTADLSHLEGQSVDVWLNGAKTGTYTVVGGSVSANDPNQVVGLRFTAKYQSAKLGKYVDASVLNEYKRIIDVGVIARDLWHGGFKYGRDFSTMYALPEIYRGAPLDLTKPVDVYDTVGAVFEGAYDADSRICLQADGPATIMSLRYSIDTANDPTSKQG